MNHKQPKGEPGIMIAIPDSTLFSFEEFVIRDYLYKCVV